MLKEGDGQTYRGVIGLDFDETYAEDPELWNSFIDLAEERGWKVICVTARDEPRRGSRNNRDIEESISKKLGEENVYFSGIYPKRNFMINNHDIFVDIWIDDCPIGIIE